MPNILIQFAHPAYSKSKVQRALVKHCSNIKGVTFNDLYEQYPDLYIDVKREKELLLQHDVIVLQHPFYWYSGPAIIKQWLDQVLEYNWAYGPQGNALAGKKFMSAISCGNAKDSYGAEGYNDFPVYEFLLPFRQTAKLCKMDYLPPFVVYGSHRLQQEAFDAFGKKYAEVLTALTHGEITREQCSHVNYINELGL